MTSGAAWPERTSPANAERDLALVLRDAWSVVRLTRLREVVNRTITELRMLHPHELLGRDLSALDHQTAANPITAALETCSAELLSEAGMPDSQARRDAQWAAVREHMMSQPEGWSDAFNQALASYRSAASRLVRAACDLAVKT